MTTKAKLLQTFGQWIDEAQAKKIAKAIRVARETRTEEARKNALELFDKELKNHGIEYLPDSRDYEHGSHGIEYSNTGDTYAATLMYDHGQECFIVGSWGDMAERHPKRFQFDN